MPDRTRLCIMSDDFGMHPAVNEGIARAFTNGLLTDANLMAPCPAFLEAAAITRQVGLPVGFHATLTCDWDRYRWGPMTGAPSLMAEDSAFPDLVSKTWRKARDEEVKAELCTQIAAIEAQGFHSTHASYHMGYDHKGRFLRIMAEIGANRTGPMRIERPDDEVRLPAYRWTSSWFTSNWVLNYEKRKKRLIAMLRRLAPGDHLWMVHAAVDHPSLDELCSPDHRAWNWARPYRAMDFRLLMDEEIRDTIEALGIQRIRVTEARVLR